MNYVCSKSKEGLVAQMENIDPDKSFKDCDSPFQKEGKHKTSRSRGSTTPIQTRACTNTTSNSKARTTLENTEASVRTSFVPSHPEASISPFDDEDYEDLGKDL